MVRMSSGSDVVFSFVADARGFNLARFTAQKNSFAEPLEKLIGNPDELS